VTFVYLQRAKCLIIKPASPDFCPAIGFTKISNCGLVSGSAKQQTMTGKSALMGLDPTESQGHLIETISILDPFRQWTLIVLCIFQRSRRARHELTFVSVSFLAFAAPFFSASNGENLRILSPAARCAGRCK